MLGIVRQRRIVGVVAVVTAVAAIALIGAGGGAADPAEAQRESQRSPTREVLAVSNNWDGTVDLVDSGQLPAAGSDQRGSRPQAAQGRDLHPA
jgi:hypothetical protein